MDSEAIKIYDIVRHFGADGLRWLLDYFYSERKEAGDLGGASYCLDDIISNTYLLTRTEANAYSPSELKLLLHNEIYFIYERL